MLAHFLAPVINWMSGSICSNRSRVSNRSWVSYRSRGLKLFTQRSQGLLLEDIWYLSEITMTTINYTHTHPFNGPLSGTTQVSRYQKGKTNLDFTEATDSEWQWNLLGHMQVCISLQTTTPAPHRSVFTGRMPFLTPNQQCQSTEGNNCQLLYSQLL